VSWTALLSLGGALGKTSEGKGWERSHKQQPLGKKRERNGQEISKINLTGGEKPKKIPKRGEKKRPNVPEKRGPFGEPSPLGGKRLTNQGKKAKKKKKARSCSRTRSEILEHRITGRRGKMANLGTHLTPKKNQKGTKKRGER